MTEPVSPVTRKNRLMQIEVFPQRLLNFETAQELLGELNKVGGITRMIVHGPRLPKGDPEKMLNGQFDAETKYLEVMGEQVELTVQVGRVWIEIEGPEVVARRRCPCPSRSTRASTSGRGRRSPTTCARAERSTRSASG